MSGILIGRREVRRMVIGHTIRLILVFRRVSLGGVTVWVNV